MSYTTDDCKNYLLVLYPHTDKKDWKRTRKYKHTNGMILRDFTAARFSLTETLIETSTGLMPLSDYLNGVPQPSSNHASAYEKFIDNLGINVHLFGGVVKSNVNQTNDLDCFLNVLAHGIDWEAPEFNRSAYDYAKRLEFDQIVQTHPNLLRDMVYYTNCTINLFYELDETYMPHHCSRSDFHDSVPDLINLIERIKQAYEKYNMPLTVRKTDVGETMVAMNDIQDMMDEEPVMINNAKRELKKMKTLLLSLHAV